MNRVFFIHRISLIMKFANKIFIPFFLLVFAFTSVNAQSEKKSDQRNTDSVLVTFECESCTKRNKFRISGPQTHVFKQAQFPIEQELKPGEYEMTYWQNKVQQIHLPFSVSSGSKTIIVVKD